MKPDLRQIHALMTSWLTGDITPEEALYLKQLVEEDPAINDIWTEFKQQFSKEDIQSAFRRYEEKDWIPAEQITAQAPSRRSAYRWIRNAGLSAAVIAGVIIGCYKLFLHRAAQQQQPVASSSNAHPGGKDDIALKLANGQMINLSAGMDSIQLDEARLNNAGKTLSFTLAARGADRSKTAAMNTLRVPIGKDYRVTLSDGTAVWLNAATTLKFPFRFSDSTREISIKGEAYLEVARNSSTPFLVHTEHGTVQVLGTSFNINDYDAGTVKVALVEGAVRFVAGKKQVIIKPGKEAVYTSEKGIRLQDFDKDEVLSWRTGIYSFSDVSLEELLTVLPRWYGIQVVIDNQRLRNHRFAGVMDRNKPVQSFLDNLATTMNISYYFDKENVLHLQ